MTSPSTAFIFAAGLGLRMRPLTLTTPKPLLEVGGKPLLGWSLDLLRAAGVRRVVINASWLAEQITAYAETVDGIECVISQEPDGPLETAGGIIRALDAGLLPEGPFFALNSDVIWRDAPGGPSLLAEMAHRWDPAIMDALLALYPVEKACGYTGSGDFALEKPTGRLTRRAEDRPAPYVFTGIQILHSRAFASFPRGAALSLRRLYYGDPPCPPGSALPPTIRGLPAPAQGQWLHVGDPAALKEAGERALLPI